PEHRDGAPHRQEAGAQYVDPVDLSRARRTDADLDRAAADAGIERPVAALARLAAEHLGIVEHPPQFAAQPPPVDDDRAGDDRAGERPPPRFVDAADDPLAAPLDRKIRHLLLPTRIAWATGTR